MQTALAELRDLAHGIYPAILTEAGLGPALWTLADDAPLPVEVGEVPAERLPEPVERAAYARGGGRDRGGRGPCRRDACAGTGTRSRSSLGGVESAPVRLADRVGALGGPIALEDGALRAEIPCA